MLTWTVKCETGIFSSYTGEVYTNVMLIIFHNCQAPKL